MKRQRMTRMLAGFVLVAGLFAGSASPVAAQSASDPRVSLASYNVCGGWDACQSPLATAPGKTPEQRAEEWAADAVNKAKLAGTDVIMLQELCKGQYDALLPKLSGYAAYFASRQTYGPIAPLQGCRAWGSDTALGQAVLFRNATAEQVSGSPVLITAGENDVRLAVCAKGPLAGRYTLACSVHLSQGTAAGDMHELTQHIQAQAGGASVIVAGDFNRTPAHINPALAAGVPTSGPLAEADAGENKPTAGWDANKLPEPGYTIKFDHVFFSSEDFASPSLKIEDPQLSKEKDHALVRAFAVPRKPTPGDLTGDGRPDLLAVRKDGSLRLYPSLGGGRFGSPCVLAATGFLGATVSHRGDWTGDGREDILAQVGTELYVYPNLGDGTLGTPVTFPNRQNTWGGTTARAAGDVDGDGRPDLVVQGGSGLWLHRGGAPATGPSLPHSAVKIGLSEWATGNDIDVLVPGNSGKAAGEPDDQDRADLWTRNRSTGQLQSYRSNGAALLDGPTTLAGTWTASQYPLAVSLGDGNGDQLADLWLTTAYTAQTQQGGNLLFQPATAGGWAVPVEVGTGGWGYIESLS
ncbi:FG-GAP-like repeat-containing protein [Streptomyces sp. NPDC058401]|uniref:FG-GAP-like repeat-containing protein n=1 Tax=Streptomyces sp. NPDC058401 TaxID=3346480 RepID=UPI0036557C6F